MIILQNQSPTYRSIEFNASGVAGKDGALWRH